MSNTFTGLGRKLYSAIQIAASNAKAKTIEVAKAVRPIITSVVLLAGLLIAGEGSFESVRQSALSHPGLPTVLFIACVLWEQVHHFPTLLGRLAYLISSLILILALFRDAMKLISTKLADILAKADDSSKGD